LRTRCVGWWHSGRCKAAQQDGRRSAVPACPLSSRYLSAGLVSKCVSIGRGTRTYGSVADDLVPGRRTAAGGIAGTFERVGNRARTGGGDLADGLAGAGGTDALLRELRQLGQTEADPVGVSAARGGRPARWRRPLILGGGRRHGRPSQHGCCGEAEQDTPGSAGTVRVGSHGPPLRRTRRRSIPAREAHAPTCRRRVKTDHLPAVEN
jgi:hypothetical protein